MYSNAAWLPFHMLNTTTNGNEGVMNIMRIIFLVVIFYGTIITLCHVWDNIPLTNVDRACITIYALASFMFWARLNPIEKTA